jgi:hypothetical protein
MTPNEMRRILNNRLDKDVTGALDISQQEVTIHLSEQPLIFNLRMDFNLIESTFFRFQSFTSHLP